MKKIIILTGLLLLTVPVVQETRADRMAIPFNARVKVFEPNQNAMIAWNGEEEILLLTTDLKASEKTKAIEVLPLPSEPQVKKGDPDVIKRAVKLINSKTRVLRRAGVKGPGEPRASAPSERPPAGEVTFHDKIGSHDISVTHVLNKEGFVEWVEKYLKSAGVDNPEIPAGLKEVVGGYIHGGFTWFVFDVVELAETLGSTEAIQYRFPTKSLFYPLKISSSMEGDSTVKLLVLTGHHVIVKNDVGVRWVKPHSSIPVRAEEASEIDANMAALFGTSKGTRLRIWEFKGSLASFKNDLIAESLRYSLNDQSLDQATRSKDGSLLWETVRTGDLSEVRKLLDLGINANWWASRFHQTALHVSAQEGFADILKLLLDRGADVNGSTKIGATPLMMAARNGRAEVVRLLLQSRADAHMKDSKGLTALHYGAEMGREETVKLLLQSGAVVNAKTSDGRTALQLAADRGHARTVELLKSSGGQE